MIVKTIKNAEYFIVEEQQNIKGDIVGEISVGRIIVEDNQDKTSCKVNTSLGFLIYSNHVDDFIKDLDKLVKKYIV